MKATYFLGNGKFETKEVPLRKPEADEEQISTYIMETRDQQM